MTAFHLKYENIVYCAELVYNQVGKSLKNVADSGKEWL